MEVADYPALIDFARILNQRPTSFRLSTVLDSELEELCLEIAIEKMGQHGLLLSPGLNVAEGLMPASSFRITLFRAFYKTGLVGLKLQRHESVSWVDEIVQSVSTAEIDESTSAVVHPAFPPSFGDR